VKTCVIPLTRLKSVFFFVELEGVEPSSKQGMNKLSTCLSSFGFSCSGKTEATNYCLILFDFMLITRLINTIPDLAAPSDHRPRSDGLWRMFRPNTLYRD